MSIPTETTIPTSRRTTTPSSPVYSEDIQQTPSQATYEWRMPVVEIDRIPGTDEDKAYFNTRMPLAKEDRSMTVGVPGMSAIDHVLPELIAVA